MSRKKKNREGLDELLVKEVIFPKQMEAGTSQSWRSHFDDKEEHTFGEPVKIGEHEVRPMSELKLLEKKPLENYFGGTKAKKSWKRKGKTKRQTKNLDDLGCDARGSDANDSWIPTTNSDSSDEETLQDRMLKLKIYKHERMREHDRQKNQTRQRLAEEKYIEELENLAETWDEYRKRRHQLEESEVFSRPQHPHRRIRAYHGRIGFSVISRKYWNDGEDSVAAPRKDETEEVVKAGEETLQESTSGELGKELFQKLVFVYDENSDGSPS